MRKSEPIAQVVADPATAPQTRERLELVQAARAFAIDELGLPDGKSYRKYADLGRPYVVHNVVATPEFSVRSAPLVLPGRRLHRLSRLLRRAARARLRAAARDPRRRRQRRRRAGLLDARPPARPGVQSDAAVARDPAGRHDLPRTRARAAVLRRRQRDQRGVRQRGRGRRRPALAAAARARRRDRRLRTGGGAPAASSPRCCARRARSSSRLYAQSAAAGRDAHREAARVRAARVRATGSCARRWGGYAGYDGVVRALAQQRAPRRRSPPTRTACRGCSGCWRRPVRCPRSTQRVAATRAMPVAARHAALCDAP